jgi:hypothetical protein
MVELELAAFTYFSMTFISTPRIQKQLRTQQTHLCYILNVLNVFVFELTSSVLLGSPSAPFYQKTEVKTLSEMFAF